MLGTADNATPALAWQALPYVLHQGLAPGDTHMGVRLLGAVELPRTRVDGIFQESIPAIHGDRAFILCSDGFLYALD